MALFGEGWQPTWGALAGPPPEGAVQLRLGPRGTARLHGRATFVHRPPGSEALVVYAAGPSGWERVIVRDQAAGLTLEDAGKRCGLGAVDVVHADFQGVEVADPDRLAPEAPGPYVRRHMLGICAIALGNARGALRAARAYAEERYQGGDLIETHPAVAMLIGDSAARIDACSAHLGGVASSALDAGAGAGAGPSEESTGLHLWRALAAKLRITEACFQAVTDCLQVLGGYGYMEEYRLEKRLRDAMTLKSLALRPAVLKQLCMVAPQGRNP